ncbi:hypothetical protein [Niabella aurantiaca]|uniref:hypothetical protein n=1 Tax=Niabella aurantiaca TaxID=379900 RepID=UPI00036EF608|nr:hypothetical protein [Niabella aurantiaca]
MRVLVSIVCLLIIFAACKKDNDQKKGYTFTTAFKNELSVPVEIRRGAIWPREPYKPDTLVYQDTLRIAAGGLYESELFICTENCDPYRVQYTSVVEKFDIAKIVIQDKERMDSACNTKARILKDPGFKCDDSPTGAPNIYAYHQYKETTDAQGNIIRREYVFDADDLAAVK